MRKILKKNKGLTGADVLLAVALIILFSGIITTISYNIYITASSLKRSSKATEYITSIFEYAKGIYYEEVTAENLLNEFNEKNSDNGVSAYINDDEKPDDKPYVVKISVEKYNETAGNEDKLDLIKEITVTVEYMLGKNTQTIQMKTKKTRENLKIPNEPELIMLDINEESNIYPIKYESGKWTVTNQNDVNWYNYENGVWATILITNSELIIGDDVESSEGNIKLWIPRFAYSDSDSKIEFLYQNTNKSVSVENGITKIEETEYTPAFSNQEVGQWISKDDIDSDPYTKFNNGRYKIKTDILNKL